MAGFKVAVSLNPKRPNRHIHSGIRYLHGICLANWLHEGLGASAVVVSGGLIPLALNLLNCQTCLEECAQHKCKFDLRQPLICIFGVIEILDTREHGKQETHNFRHT